LVEDSEVPAIGGNLAFYDLVAKAHSRRWPQNISCPPVLVGQLRLPDLKSRCERKSAHIPGQLSRWSWQPPL